MDYLFRLKLCAIFLIKENQQIINGESLIIRWLIFTGEERASTGISLIPVIVTPEHKA